MVVENDCDLYGCNRPKNTSTDVLLMVDGEPKNPQVCDFHIEFFKTVVPEDYTLGTTNGGQIELRLTPAIPQTPSA